MKKALPKTAVAELRGRNKAMGGVGRSDITRLLDHIGTLESLLDEADCDDVFGTEGWRHRLDIEE